MPKEFAANKPLFLLTVLGIALLLAAAAAASAAPRQGLSSSRWTPARCEQDLLGPGRDGYAIPNTDRHYFVVAQGICVGSGGQRTCSWSANHHSRLYSEFTVFSYSHLRGLVRSFTLDTRGRHGVRVRIRYKGGSLHPDTFYVSNFRLIGRNATEARFWSAVRPTAARLVQQQNEKGCAS